MLRKTHLASLAVAGIASLSIISSAHADGYEPAGKAMAAPVAAYAWGGLYVGVGIGGAQFDNNVGVDGHKKTTRKKKCIKYGGCSDYGIWKPWGQKTTFGSGSSGDDEWNVFGTAQIGYDHLLGKRFLVGVFADYDFFPQSDNSITTTLSDKYGEKVGHVDGNLNLDGIWSVGGKLGFVVAPRWAIYGAGGYSEAKIRGSADVHFYGRNGGQTVNLDLDDELQGWFLEAGSEVKVARNVAFKFAYRYQEFDDSRVSGSAYGGYRYVKQGCHSYYKCASKTDAWAKSDIDTEIHSIRATLVIGLNPVPRAVVPLK